MCDLQELSAVGELTSRAWKSVHGENAAEIVESGQGDRLPARADRNQYATAQLLHAWRFARHRPQAAHREAMTESVRPILRPPEYASPHVVLAQTHRHPTSP